MAPIISRACNLSRKRRFERLGRFFSFPPPAEGRGASLHARTPGPKASGFTLVEVLIAIALLGLVTGSIYNFLINQRRAWDAQTAVAAAQRDARLALDLMARQLRMAGYNNSSGSAITEALANSLTFKADLNNDGTAESVAFALDSTDSSNKKLKRNNDVLLQNVSDLKFTYIYANGQDSDSAGLPNDTDTNEDNDLSDVKKVKISLTVKSTRIDPTIGTYRTRNYVVTITPRNVGLF